MVAPAWGGHRIHGEETDERLGVGDRDHQHRHTREEGKSVVEFEEEVRGDYKVSELE